MRLAWSIRALEVKNGQVVWDQAIGDRKDGFGLTGGPLVARGKVMVGTIGRAAGGNVILALDAATRKEAWRFHVLAGARRAGRQQLERLTAQCESRPNAPNFSADYGFRPLQQSARRIEEVVAIDALALLAAPPGPAPSGWRDARRRGGDQAARHIIRRPAANI